MTERLNMASVHNIWPGLTRAAAYLEADAARGKPWHCDPAKLLYLLQHAGIAPLVAWDRHDGLIPSPDLTPGPWYADRSKDGTEWHVAKRGTSQRVRIGTVGGGRVDYFERAMAEAERRNAANHPHVTSGRCTFCGHYGDDCTGQLPPPLNEYRVDVDYINHAGNPSCQSVYVHARNEDHATQLASDRLRKWKRAPQRIDGGTVHRLPLTLA